MNEHGELFKGFVFGDPLGRLGHEVASTHNTDDTNDTTRQAIAFHSFAK